MDQIRESLVLRDHSDTTDSNMKFFSDPNSESVCWALRKEPFDDEIPEYETEALPSRDIKIGKSLDVNHLLAGCKNGGFVRCVPNTSDSDDVQSNFQFVQVGFDQAFKKKNYVMIFCVFAPSKWCKFNASALCRLSVLSSQLLHSGRDDFEMVMVAKMRKKKRLSYDDEEAFHTFFSAFPGRLAIPYSNNKARDYVCATLNFDGGLNVVLVGPAPHHEILQCSSSFLLRYGADGFPFTDHALRTLPMKSPRLSLPDILSCDPSCCLSTVGSQKTKSISVRELSKKVVGLYLFQTGDKFRTFYDVYNQCQQHGDPFEIVLVCMPLYPPSHPDVVQEVHKHLGLLSIDVSSWWVFPYNNSACRRRIEDMFTEFSPGNDQMFIVGPDGKFVDARGGDVIKHFGIKAYPFIREVLVTKYLKKVNEVTLESLLGYGTKNYILRRWKEVPLSYLKGRNVLFYVDRAPLCMFTYGILCEWYNNIRKCDPSVQLVFVCYTPNNERRPIVSILPWLKCYCDPDHTAWLENHSAFCSGFDGESFIEGIRPPKVIAFGKDGGIHTLDPISLERMYGRKVNPFKPEFKDLRRDVILQMKGLELMRGYGGYPSNEGC